MIVTTMDYQLFETDILNLNKLVVEKLDSNLEGMVEFGSNYYTLLGENSIILRDEDCVKEHWSYC